jgi:hypothetical protein
MRTQQTCAGILSVHVNSKKYRYSQLETQIQRRSSMIKICSFFELPIEEQRIGPVFSIANSYPHKVRGVAGKVACLVPKWADVEAYKDHQISEQEFTARYRELIQERWPAVKKWLDSLQPGDELYLCCWEREGFCHRYLVAKLIQKFRPDLEIRVT